MEFKVVTPNKILLGTEDVEMLSGQRLNIRVRGVDGVWTDILREQVPSGMSWQVALFVRAAEDDN